MKDLWFSSTSGQKVFLLEPDPRVVKIEDIAASLSKICRFNGHCRVFYSVAQHSVLVARYIKRKYHLHGLLHDATEAYVQDIISPLKRFLGEPYKNLERQWEAAIAEAFKIVWDPDARAEVTRVDLSMLATEARDLLKADAAIWTKNLPEPYNERIEHAWSPETAAYEFLGHFGVYRR